MRCRACDAPARLSFTKDGDEGHVCPACGALSRRRGPGDFAARYEDYLPAATLALPPGTRERYREMLADLTEAIPGAGRRLLDVGAGAGLLLEVARDAGFTGTGTELSAAAAREAVRRGIEVLVGDLPDLALEPASFDAAVTLETVEHVPDPVAFLRAVARLLVPGGPLLLTTPNYGALSRRLLGREWLAVSADHVCLLTPRALARALVAAGFEVDSIRTRTILPNEVLKRFRRAPARRAGFRAAETAALQASFSARRGLRLVKRAVNALLGAAGLGDVIVARATRAAAAGPASPRP